ncbi:hypothetical protein NQ315_005893 [Exocentrus adspersus]|uniref:DUF4817 domain-containing protein n=1 Tax=Exocentrus adspersus TaxID=1586481 RepID=A0AAV8V958_9CUCU|nr:hypothetical protein NQ315_005893 [Exocentrus adspersus]
MAHVYSNNELVDMILVYGEAHQNSELASRMYAQRFPTRFTPAPRRFVTLIQRARDSGNLQPNRGRDGGRNSPDRIIHAEDQILELVRANPTRSTRSIGRQLGISNKVVWRTLREDLQHPFHYQRNGYKL